MNAHGIAGGIGSSSSVASPRSSINKIIIIMLLLVLTINLVSGIGVVPSSKDILLDTNQKEFPIKILNSENEEYTVVLYVEGDLEEYISLSKELIEFTENKEEQIVTVKLNIPEGIEEGEHLNKIIVRKINTANSQITANINLGIKLRITVPYTDAFLTAKLLTPNFEQNKENNFVLEIENKGIKNAVGVSSLIEIYSPTNEKLQTITIEKKTIEAKKKKQLLISWTPTFPNGKYFAKASIIYNGKTIISEKVLTIGTPELSIEEISTGSFKLGGIASFDLIINNNWAETITNAYADVEISQEGNLLAKTETPTKNIPPLGKEVFTAYWDTQGLAPGGYQMLVNLNYLGMSKSEEFNIILETNEVRIDSPSGRFVSEGKGGSLNLLVALVIMLIILNVYLIIKKKKLKRKK